MHRGGIFISDNSMIEERGWERLHFFCEPSESAQQHQAQHNANSSNEDRRSEAAPTYFFLC